MIGVAAPTPAAPSPPAAPAALDPGDWPMYGYDASRTNYNPAESTISPANVNQLVSRWQVLLPNIPDSLPAGAPSIANGRVYAGSSTNLVLDTVTGTPLWNAPLAQGRNCFAVSIGATPAISSTRVVFGGGPEVQGAAYYGYNSVGALLWRDPLDVGPSGFPWSSPLIHGELAYFGIAADCDNPSVRGELRAVDLTTGTIRARQYFVEAGERGAGVWNSAALSPDGSTLVVVTGEDFDCDLCTYARSLVTLDPQTLAIRQHDQQGEEDEDQDWGTTPVIFHDSQGRALVGAAHKNGTFYTYLLDNVAAGPLWSRATGVDVGMMPAYDPSFGAGGTLFIDSGTLYAVDPATGVDRWPPITGGYAHGNMAIANGLIFRNTGATGVEIRAETTGALVRTLAPALAGPSYSGVAVAHGFVYWLSGFYLNAWSLPATTPPCSSQFADVPADSPFYNYIRCLVCQGIISGYSSNPPCGTNQYTCFQGGAAVTRGQMSKFVANAAGYNDPIPSTQQTFTDVPYGHPFWLFIERAALHGVINGYNTQPPCTTGIPCFLAAATITRGQMAKLIANGANYQDPVGSSQQTFSDVPPTNPFWLYIERIGPALHNVVSGYDCGQLPAGPCDPQQRPYYLAGGEVTRGQTAKFIANALYPNCAPGATPPEAGPDG